MSKLFTLAVVGAAATSGIALFDAIHHGITGRYSMFSADTELPAAEFAASLVHGVTYAALGAVLLLQSRASDGGRVYRWMCRLLGANFAVLAALFLVGEPIRIATGLSLDTTPVGAVIGNFTFLLMFVFGFALGLTLLRRPDRRPSAILLVAVGPVLAMTVVGGAMGSGFAHPAYAETLINFGVALLALPSRVAQPDHSQAVRESAAAEPHSASR